MAIPEKGYWSVTRHGLLLRDIGGELGCRPQVCGNSVAGELERTYFVLLSATSIAEP